MDQNCAESESFENPIKPPIKLTKNPLKSAHNSRTPPKNSLRKKYFLFSIVKLLVGNRKKAIKMFQKNILLFNIRINYKIFLIKKPIDG
jgi:hypothetical protein